MQEMNLIKDYQFDKLSEGNITSALPSDNIPFLWSCDNHL